MNWETKLQALKAFAPHHLEMRKPGDWYVCSNVEIVSDGVLIGEYGNGTTPEEAVADHWRRLVDDLPLDKYLRGGTPGHTTYAKWNGFMWADASHMRKQKSVA